MCLNMYLYITYIWVKVHFLMLTFYLCLKHAGIGDDYDRKKTLNT